MVLFHSDNEFETVTVDLTVTVTLDLMVTVDLTVTVGCDC